MIGETLVGLVLTAAAISPGATFVRTQELYEPQAERSPLRELAELFFIGSLATSFAAMAVLTLNQLGHPLDTDRLQIDALGYLLDDPIPVFGAIVLTLLLSHLGAWRLACEIYRDEEPTIQPGSVLSGVLSQDKITSMAFCTVELRDGRAVHGQCWAYPTQIVDDDRDIALRRPIRWRPALDVEGSSSWRLSNDDCVVVPGGEVVAISVVYASPPPGAPRAA